MTLNELKTAIKNNTPVYYVNREAQNTLVMHGYESHITVTKWKVIDVHFAKDGMLWATLDKKDDREVARYYELFTSKSDALMYLENPDDYIVLQYCKEIKDVNDLAQFPLKHDLHSNTLRDTLALKAYKQRVKELLDIEM